MKKVYSSVESRSLHNLSMESFILEAVNIVDSQSFSLRSHFKILLHRVITIIN